MKLKIIIIAIFLHSIILSLNNYAADQKKFVIVIHGMTRSSSSMKKMAQFLTSNGYTVYLFDYATRKHSIQEISFELQIFIKKQNLPESAKINFVTHSMGAVILRDCVSKYGIKTIGRVVMLSPPNNGSEAVDFFSGIRISNYIIGPSFNQLKTDENSFVNSLPLPDFEYGVITGKRSINWVNSVIIPGPDDGKVSLESASLPNMKDFKVVAHTHPFIMNSKEVMGYTLNFIEYGFFGNY